MFRDRTEAGRALAAAARRLVAERPEFARPVVLALPRGGVPVAVEVARALGAPLDLVLVRKIGAPFQPELAVGAVVDGATPELVLNPRLARHVGLEGDALEAARSRALAEIDRRRKLWLGDREPAPLTGRGAVLVDDGAATGSSARAALAAVRRRGPSALAIALPVAPPEVVEMLRPLADAVICLEMPRDFLAVGAHYADFEQVPDEAVARLLADRDVELARTSRGAPNDGGDR